MNEQSIFLAALDIADPTERADYVNRSCGGDEALRRQVEDLLAAHDRSGAFLDVPALRQMAAHDGADPDSHIETSAEPQGVRAEINLSFLQPTAKAGSLGRLGHYEVLEVLGQGGFGIVVKALDEKLQRLVAVKVMSPHLAATSPPRKRFLREARAAAAVRHENVVAIYAVEEQPIPYLVMEYIAGQTLQQKLDQQGPLDVGEVVRIGLQVAEGLEAAHATGLIHRDIKPGNILLEQGRDRVKITDFGLARSADDASLTQSGVIAGTPLYMSPEQAQGVEIDQRSDLFSLGSVLYVMCSGRPPFRAATTLAVLKRVAEEQPRPVHEIIPEVPDWLVAIIAKLHAKNPAERFASAREVADLLERCRSELHVRGNGGSLAGVPTPPAKPAAAVAEPPRAAPSPSRPRRWLAAAAVIGLAIAGLGLGEATGLTKLRGTIIRLFSPDGTLVVELDDPGVSVSIDGEEVVIAGAGVREIRLKPGQYKVVASKDGQPVRQELVTVTKHGRQVVRVSKESERAELKPPSVVPSTVDDAWIQSVAALPTAKQVDAVVRKLRELNPRFDGVSRHVVDGGAVTELEFSSAGVTDLTPVRALRGLKRLRCEAPPMGKVSELADLSPLRGMRLVLLNCHCTSVTDLTPLENMPLEELGCSVTQVGDLSPLKGMPLKQLYLHATPVTDLSPIKGMQLEVLMCDRTRVVDLSPIKGMPLRSIFCEFNRERHAEILRSIKTLAWINHRTSEKFWAEVDGAGTINGVPAPSAALQGLRRDQIPAEALALAGDGDPKRAPASLVAMLGEARPFQKAAIRGLAYSPDGRWIASASQDKSILLREGGTGRVSRSLEGHAGAVSGVAFSKDGSTLVSASHDSTLKFWPVEKPGDPETLQPKLGEIHTLAASSDGRFLAAGGTNELIKLWKWGEWNTPVVIPTLPGKVHALAFSPNGDQLAASEGKDADARIRIYQTSDGSLAKSWEAGQGPVHALAFHRDGKWLATTGGSTFVRLWEVASGKRVAEANEWAPWGAMTFHPDGKTLYAFLPYERGIFFTVPDLKPPPTGRKVYLEPPVTSVSYSPDGKCLALGTHDGDVIVWDTVKDEKQLPSRGHTHYVSSLAVAPDGKALLSLGDDNVLRRWDFTRPGESQIVHQFDRGVLHVAWSPDGKAFATSAAFTWYDSEQRGDVWDASTGKRRFSLDPRRSIWGISYSPDGHVLAGCCLRDNRVSLWDAGTGKEVHRFPKVGQHTDPPAFSGDGKLLAVATSDTKTVKVWNVATGAEVHSREDQPMSAFALSKDGRFLAAGHFNGNISLWDLATEGKKRNLEGHTARVNTLRFTPDGKTLVSSSDDGTIRVWDPGVPRALRDVISVGPAKRRLVIDLDPSGEYVFASGAAPVIYVLKLAAPAQTVAPADDPDRRAAEFILSPARNAKDAVQANDVDQWLHKPEDLPSRPFRLTGIGVTWGSKLTDADLENFKGCTHVKILNLCGTAVTKKGLAIFNECRELRQLNLVDGAFDDSALKLFKDRAPHLIHLDLRGNVTDAGLANFSDSTKLETLAVAFTRASDKGLALFKNNKKLKHVSAIGTAVSDAGLEHLAGMPSLQRIHLQGTHVTEGGVKRLATARPTCRIEWNGEVIDPAGRRWEKPGTDYDKIAIGRWVPLLNTKQEFENLVAKRPFATDDWPAKAVVPRLKYENGELECHAGGILFPAMAAKDAILRAKVKKLEGHNIHLRLRDHDGKFLAVCFNGGGYFCLGRHREGWKDLRFCSLPNLNNGYFELAFASVGRKLTAYVNGWLILEVDDDTPEGAAIQAGLPGLAASWSQGASTGLYKDVEFQILDNLTADRRAAQYVLSIGGTVQINGVNRSITKASELPSEPFRLTEVNLLDNPKVTDAGLASFQGCKDIASLSLVGTPFSDAGLAHFKDCKSLTMLALHGTSVTDAGLGVFKDCRDLTYLGLKGTKVGNAGLAHFKDCKKLKELDVRGAHSITDAGLAHLKDCTEMEALLLDGTKVTDVGLAHFKDHDLSKLELIGTGVTDAGLALFKDQKNLSGLKLDGTDITDAGLAHLKNCKKLTHVQLVGTRVTEAGLAHLKDCKVATLWLDGTPLTDKSIDVLREFGTLRSLALKGTKVTEAGVKKLAEALPLCTITWNGGAIKPKT
jgi:WD40 repeat protein